MPRLPQQQRPVMHRPPQGERPVMHKPTKDQRPVMHRPPQGERPAMHKPTKEQRPVMHRPPQGERPAMHRPTQEQRPVMHRPPQDEHPVMHKPTKEQRPAMHRPPQGERPVMHKPTKEQRPVMHRPPQGERPLMQRSIGQRPLRPRHDLHRPPGRPPAPRHVVHRPPAPPPRHYWHYRPPHKRHIYRGYYKGIYYDNVLATLLAAGIISSALDSSTTVNNNEYIISDTKAKDFIPKEAIRFEGHHFHVFSDIGDTMDDAQQFCESIGGHLATVGSDKKNLRMYRLINSSGYDNSEFEIAGQERLIMGEPVQYEKVDPLDEASDEYYGMYYWQYNDVNNPNEKAGNAFICEWDY